MGRDAGLPELFRLLLDSFGPQHWWPGETPFEVLVGAVLTQNTSWRGVAQAIANLKREGVLSLEGLLGLEPERLAQLIRPAGYFNLKQKRLRNLLELLQRDFGGDLDRLFALPLAQARQVLLSSNGVGPETADSILLYAGEKPIFVVDAYTFRILGRHGFAVEEMDYHQVQALFMDNLPHQVALFNEFHALLVKLGKDFCKKGKPRCPECPAQGWGER